MKKSFLLMSVAALAFAFTSCEKEPVNPQNPDDGQEQNDDKDDEEMTKEVNATLSFSIPAELNLFEPEFGIQKIELKDINTDEIITPVSTTTRAISTINVVVNVPEGVYSVNMEALVHYTKDGMKLTSNLRGYAESITITEATANVPYMIETYVYNSADKSGFIISEIFFTGTLTPEGEQYSADNYIRIFNNSSETLCADGLTIVESEFMTVQKYDYKPDIMDEAMTVGAIYRIPLGSKVMVEPGESILIVDQANDHRTANSNSFDLTSADFEWYDKHDNPNFQDTDNPDVPNLERIYTYSKTVWSFHNRGFKSVALCRLGEDEANQLKAEDYLSNYVYKYSYDMVIGDEVYPMPERDAYKIPNSWILDAVNLSIESDFQWIVTSPVLDKGWTSCGKVDRDMNRYGKCVRRKLNVGKTLVDTNNSTEDFLRDQEADPFFKYHE